MLETAFLIWEKEAVHRKIAKDLRPITSVNDIGTYKKREDFGRGPVYTAEAASIIEANMKKMEQAGKLKDDVAEAASEAARQALAETSETTASILVGPVEQLNLVEEGNNVFIKVLGTDGLKLRAPILDLDCKVPRAGDEVAVTGFGGNVWFGGSVVSCFTKRTKVCYKVHFTHDNTIADCPLLDKRYGPANVVEVGGGKAPNVTGGWMYIQLEADHTDGGRGAAPTVTGIDGGSAADVSEISTELMKLVYESACGGSQTIAALKREKVRTVDDLKQLDKAALREGLHMTYGDANRLLKAVADP
jgi:hypothetical protein